MCNRSSCSCCGLCKKRSSMSTQATNFTSDGKLRKVPSLSAIHNMGTCHHHHTNGGHILRNPFSASATELSFFPPEPIQDLDAHLHPSKQHQLPSLAIHHHHQKSLFAVPKKRIPNTLSTDPEHTTLMNNRGILRMDSDDEPEEAQRRPRVRRRTGESTWLQMDDAHPDASQNYEHQEEDQPKALARHASLPMILMTTMMKDVGVFDQSPVKAVPNMDMPDVAQSVDARSISKTLHSTLATAVQESNRNTDAFVASGVAKPTESITRPLSVVVPTIVIPTVTGIETKISESPSSTSPSSLGMPVSTANNLNGSSTSLDEDESASPYPTGMSQALRACFDALDNNASPASTPAPDYPLLPEFATKYTLMDLLGRGATAFVASALRKDGVEVAVKFIYKDRIPVDGWKRDRPLGCTVPIEIFTLRRLEHPNIVRFLEVFEDSTFFYFVQESVHAFGSEPLAATTTSTQAPSATSVSSSLSTVSALSIPTTKPTRSLIVTPVREAAAETLRLSRGDEKVEKTPIAAATPASTPVHANTASTPVSVTQLPIILQLSHSSHFHHNAPPTAEKKRRPTGRKGTRRPSQDLFECIERNPKMHEDAARVIFAQIADAIGYMHGRGFVHRDIKDENVIIDDSLRVKLIDFGTARAIPTSEHDFFDDLCGTLVYTAPEVLAGGKYRGPEADVWSLGVLLFILVESTLPFPPDANDVSSRQVRPALKSKRSIACRDLLFRMLDPNPETRIVMSDVVAHPWIVGGENAGGVDSGVEAY
ncbi:hypothetical protein HDU97_006983 [Phlyctochytrium planicorne]|nr:hypothetical protein HDU97_006983 [Phlyctochytrium planicorne]